MIVGIGIDIVEVKRIKKLINGDNGKKFLRRVYTEREIEYCEKFKEPYTHFAARFAGKEAFVKASSDILESISYKDVEIINNSKNAPLLFIKNKNFDNNKYICYISLSHTENYGCAFVIIEKKKGVA